MTGMRRLLGLLVLCCAAFASVALAATTKNGITPKAPKKGATVAVGSQPVFKGRVSGDTPNANDQGVDSTVAGNTRDDFGKVGTVTGLF